MPRWSRTSGTLPNKYPLPVNNPIQANAPIALYSRNLSGRMPIAPATSGANERSSGRNSATTTVLVLGT